MICFPLRAAAAVLVTLAAASAQQLEWQVPASGPSTVRYVRMMPFGDYNHDGYQDFLRYVQLQISTILTLQIASGLDGSTLWGLGSSYMTGPVACHAGDMDGDGEPDLAILYVLQPLRYVEITSPSTGQVLWTATGPVSALYGDAMLGDLDVNGDGRPDFVTITADTSASDIYVYDNGGALLYTVPCLSQGRIAISLCKMGDMNGDGCDDFLVGCNDITDQGTQILISGLTGAILRQSYGLLPGDRTSALISNLGDIDGDGVNDYAAFPYWSSLRAIAVAYSGGTGAVIRTWPDYANSVVTGEDYDQDGVNDIVTGADWAVQAPSVYGRTLCYSGRDGSELWRVDNFSAPQGTGHNGSSGWMQSSASLGVQPGNPYPVMAWMDLTWVAVATSLGRIRAYVAARSGQGPVTGVACTSSGTLPLIGVRKLGAGATNTGSRITVAKTHANALAALNFAFTALPTPVDLTPFGFAGCTVYLDPAASALTLTGTTGIDRGYAAIDLPHPLAAAAVGTNVVAQWLVYDPATLAHAATQVHALRLQ